MRTTVDDIDKLLTETEAENLEFKEAKNSFKFDTLAKICAALANEGGGMLVLGVSDRRPRKVVGTKAFQQLEEESRRLRDVLHLRVVLDQVAHPCGRVLVFQVPSRPVGELVACHGRYWGREGDSLRHLSSDEMRAILDEGTHDFSARTSGAQMTDLDPQAIEEFRRRWADKSHKPGLNHLSQAQLLSDAELVVDGEVTYAGLVLLGTPAALSRYLPDAELIFEYRMSSAPGPAASRREYRQGFLSIHDDLWKTVNLRNEVQHYQEGLFIRDIPTFDERTVREAVLNAVCHRNYQLPGSVFIRQYSRRMVVESPGGFPTGVTAENVVDRSVWRNRRIAESLAKCGLVERSGQGMDLMFERSIRQGKRPPDFAGTDDYQVVVNLDCQIEDVGFLRFLEEVGKEQTASFSAKDFLALNIISRRQTIPDYLRREVSRLAELGIVENVGRGRGARTILSKRFFRFLGKSGTYTRHRGLDREANKQILLKHIRDSEGRGCPMSELRQVLPSHADHQVRYLLKLLRADGSISLVGRGGSARWHPERVG